MNREGSLNENISLKKQGETSRHRASHTDVLTDGEHFGAMEQPSIPQSDEIDLAMNNFDRYETNWQGDPGTAGSHFNRAIAPSNYVINGTHQLTFGYLPPSQNFNMPTPPDRLLLLIYLLQYSVL